MNTLELLSPICDCLVPVCDSLLPNNPPAGELVLDQVLNNPSALPNNPTALNTELLNAASAPDLASNNPENVLPSVRPENLLIPERRFEDVFLFKDLIEGNFEGKWDESIKLHELENESKKFVMPSSYFSTKFQIYEICSLYK